jgi:hypothetical protein
LSFDAATVTYWDLAQRYKKALGTEVPLTQSLRLAYSNKNGGRMMKCSLPSVKSPAVSSGSPADNSLLQKLTRLQDEQPALARVVELVVDDLIRKAGP